MRTIEGYEENNSILFLCATNRKNDLDAAFINRFDLILHYEIPPIETRKLIFKQYAKQLSEEEIDQLAKNSDKLSGRDIKDICDLTERRWAAHIIKVSSEVSPPPLSEYIKSLNNRIGYQN